MAQHRWTALGSAGMSTERAREWAETTVTGTAGGSMYVSFSGVVCLACLEPWEEAGDVCHPPPTDAPHEHAWQAFFTAPLTQEDAAAWMGGGDLDPGHPQSVAVICVLCGDSADGAPADCSERTLWTKDSTLDIDPAELAEAAPTADTASCCTGRIPQYRMLCDVDGDRYVVSDPAETDTDEWRLVAHRSDGSQEELEPTIFWGVGAGQYEGRPAWFAGWFESYEIEIHVPGQMHPHTVSAGWKLGWSRDTIDSRHRPDGPDDDGVPDRPGTQRGNR